MPDNQSADESDREENIEFKNVSFFETCSREPLALYGLIVREKGFVGNSKVYLFFSFFPLYVLLHFS